MNFLSEKRALKLLQAPLKFGNPEQIEARQWLEVSAELKGCEVNGECQSCHGTGEVFSEYDPGELRTVSQLRELAREVEESES